MTRALTAMPVSEAKPEREVIKAYPLHQFADKLLRLTDAVEVEFQISRGG